MDSDHCNFFLSCHCKGATIYMISFVSHSFPRPFPLLLLSREKLCLCKQLNKQQQVTKWRLFCDDRHILAFLSFITLSTLPLPPPMSIFKVQTGKGLLFPCSTLHNLCSNGHETSTPQFTCQPSVVCCLVIKRGQQV